MVADRYLVARVALLLASSAISIATIYTLARALG